MALRPCNPFNYNNYLQRIENFIQFVTRYIQGSEINGHRGWGEQLRSYEYKYNGGVADYQSGIATRLSFHQQLKRALDAGDTKELKAIVNKIMKWGGMKPYEKEPIGILNSFKILDSLNKGNGNWGNLIW